MEDYERLCKMISKEGIDVPCDRLNKHSNSNENFCMKPKRKGSVKNLQVICDEPSCQSTNVDMIRCNLCTKFVCEQCNEVPVAKLKVIMDKCKTLYFICKNCNKNYPDNSNTNKETDKQQTQGEKANSKDIVETFEDTLNHKIEQLESKLESIIESKLGEKMNTLIAFNKSIQEQCDTLNKASVSYSACVQGTSTLAGTQSLRV